MEINRLEEQVKDSQRDKEDLTADIKDAQRREDLFKSQKEDILKHIETTK